MKRIVCLILIIFIALSFLSYNLSVVAEQEYGWVLTEIEDRENKDLFSASNKSSEYNIVGNYGRSNYSIAWTYIGKTKNNYDPPMVNGESITFNASFSSPPQVIRANEEVTINLSLSAGGNNLSFFTPYGSARAQIGKPGSGYRDFKNENDKGSFKTDSKNNYEPFNEKLVAEVHGGNVGEKLEIINYLYCSNKLETAYIYEWKVINQEALEIEDYVPKDSQSDDETMNDTEESNENTEAYPEGHVYEVMKDENGNYRDSGCRFIDFTGEVLIRRGDQPLSWEAASLDTIIYEGDVIKVSYDSSAQFNFDDLTTFKLPEETRIYMDVLSKPENKIKLLAGKILSNVKKIIRVGSMNVEMFQAVAGIKGTTFIVEEDGETSSLKVFEGEVEFFNDDSSVIISEGMQAFATSEGISEPTQFDIEQEINQWDESSQSMIQRALLNTPGEDEQINEGENPSENNIDLPEESNNDSSSNLLRYSIFGLAVVIAVLLGLKLVRK